MPLENNNINWNQAEMNFQGFLSRHLNIAKSSVDIEGIVWNANRCWYVMNATRALIQAPLIDEAIKSNSKSNDWKLGTDDIVVLSFVGIAALSVAVIGIYVLKR
jgi:integral membrane sensor domain MASE1